MCLEPLSEFFLLTVLGMPGQHQEELPTAITVEQNSLPPLHPPDHGFPGCEAARIPHLEREESQETRVTGYARREQFAQGGNIFVLFFFLILTGSGQRCID